MKRRTLFKTGLLATLGSLLPTSLFSNTEKIIEKPIVVEHLIPKTFEEFFKVVNGFEMNKDQRELYRFICNRCSVYGRRQIGMSTLMNTMALYDATFCCKRVCILTLNNDSKMRSKIQIEIMINRLYVYTKSHLTLEEFSKNFNIFIFPIIETRYRSCGLRVDNVYVQDDAFKITDDKRYADFSKSTKPILSCNDGRIIVMGTYELM